MSRVKAGLIGLVICCGPWSAYADVKSKAAREAAEYALEKLGIKAAAEAIDTLAARIESLAGKYGDEVYQAVRNVGPKAVDVLEQSGAKAGKAAQVMAKLTESQAWLVHRPQSWELVAKFGDDAAQALLKHPGIAESIIEKEGVAGAKALVELSEQNGRRLAMLAGEGELAAIPQSPKFLAAVNKYGDKAMDFVWKHKGALAVSATLTAFLANPEKFIDGVTDLAQVGADTVTKPIVEGGKELAKHTDGTLVAIAAAIAVTLLLGFRMYLRQRQLAARQK